MEAEKTLLLVPTHPEAKKYVEGWRSKKSVSIHPENVIRHNSLQVTFSSRFVYCEKKKFELIKQMIADNEKYKTALRPTWG